jgi:hypothetical protein
MDPRDLEAMRLAIETLRRDPELSDQIELMLRNQSEQEVGAFAAGFCQVRNLKLKGWECPPVDSSSAEPADCYGHRANEVALLRRMLRAGVSRFHPDPLAALTVAESKPAA